MSSYNYKVIFRAPYFLDRQRKKWMQALEFQDIHHHVREAGHHEWANRGAEKGKAHRTQHRVDHGNREV